MQETSGIGGSMHEHTVASATKWSKSPDLPPVCRTSTAVSRQFFREGKSNGMVRERLGCMGNPGEQWHAPKTKAPKNGMCVAGGRSSRMGLHLREITIGAPLFL
jgi:hypothetical protein